MKLRHSSLTIHLIWNGFDPLFEFEVVDYGDLAFDYAKVADVPYFVHQDLEKIIFQGPVSVTLGDDHFITLPILRDYDKKYERLIVIQFDTYSDLWANDDIGRIDHGTLM